MPTSLIAPLVTTGLTAGANALFGGGSNKQPLAPLQNFSPLGINAGGLSTNFDGDRVNLTASGDRLGLVSNIGNQFGLQADELAALKARVAPGISELRASKLQEIENAKTAAVGNLRENLQRRRVLGSSFGQDAITRAESEFGQAKSKAAAESFLQEMEMTNNLIQQEFTARRSQFQTGLDELNLEASVATGLATKATDAMSSNAKMLAALQAQESAASGKFFGQTFQPVFKSAGEAAGKFFTSGGSGGSFSSAMPTDI